MDPMMLKKILQDKIKLAYIVSFLVLIIFAFLLLVKGDMGKIYSSKGLNLEVSDNLDTLKTIAEYKEYINEFDSKFTVSGKSTNWLIETVTGIANAKSVPLRLVRPLENTAFSNYKTISVLMEGNAPYHNIANFISSLENNEKYIVIEKFELKAQDTAPAWQEQRFQRPSMPFPASMSYPQEEPVPATPRLQEENTRATFQEGRTATFRLTVTCFNLRD